MAEQFPELMQVHNDFIKAQPLFFVATAGAEGLINLSPKGMDSLRIVDSKRVVWLNLTGSGNETAAHGGKKNLRSLDGKPTGIVPENEQQ